MIAQPTHPMATPRSGQLPLEGLHVSAPFRISASPRVREVGLPMRQGSSIRRIPERAPSIPPPFRLPWGKKAQGAERAPPGTGGLRGGARRVEPRACGDANGSRACGDRCGGQGRQGGSAWTQPRRVGEVLVADVGNTETQAGACLDDGELAATWAATTPERLHGRRGAPGAARAARCLARRRGAGSGRPQAVRRPRHGLGACPTSPSRGARALQRACGRRALVVGPGLKTGLKMRYNDPAEIGRRPRRRPGGRPRRSTAAPLRGGGPGARRPTSR